MIQSTPTVTTRKVKNNFQLTISYFLSSLAILVFISSCCPKQECKSTALWDGKYVEGIVINQATKFRGNIGMFLVNLDEVNPSKDRYICLYNYNENKEMQLGDRFFITASESNGIPMVDSVRGEVPTEELYSGRIKTNINEHSGYEHGFDQGIHKKAHFKPGAVLGTYILSVGSSNYTMDQSHPLNRKADNMYKHFYPNTFDQRVNVFYEVLGSNVTYLDTCHYHNGISMGCTNN